MYGTVYRIFNIKSGKSYIGKTFRDPYDRLKEHIRDIDRFGNRPLYRAFRKYGLEAFSFEILGEYPMELVEEKEIQFIAEYASYGSKGYNATKGGDGTRYLDVTRKLLQHTYNELKTVRAVALKLDIDECYCGKLFKLYDIELFTRTEVNNSRQSKIRIVDNNMIFNSRAECAAWFIETNLVDSNTKQKSIEQSISKVCRGVRPQYKSFRLEYI